MNPERRDTPVPHEPGVPFNRATILATSAGWVIVLSISALLWWLGGWWMIPIGWFIIAAVVGLIAGNCFR